MAAEKLISGGRPPGMNDQALGEMIDAWAQLGVQLSPQDFGPPKPAKYQLAKITMAIQNPVSTNHGKSHVLQNSLWGKLSQVNRVDSKRIIGSFAALKSLIR
jgi:hypothetical protein